MEKLGEIKKQAQGRQQFLHNGQLIYEWDQTLDEVNIYIKPPKICIKKYQDEYRKQLKPGEKLPQLEVKIMPSHLTVGIKGNPPFLNEELGGKINSSDSVWMIEDEELHILLAKMYKAETWTSACKGHVKLDPLAESEAKKKILLERFQQENPGFDFSGAEVNGMVPDPQKFMGGVKYS